MKIKFPSTDRLIGLTAVLISSLTLAIFIYQTNIINKQSRLSVRLRLSYNNRQVINDSIVTYSEIITNKGLGPAIVTGGKIAFEGDRYPIDFNQLFSEKYPDLEKFGRIRLLNQIPVELTLMPGESVTLYAFETNAQDLPNLIKYLGIDSAQNQVPWSIELTYTSIYEEEWKFSSRDNKPIRQ